MSQESQQSFFDVRTIIAIVVMAGTFMGWQAYMQHKYPDAFKKKEEVAQAKSTPAGGAIANDAKMDIANPKLESGKASAVTPQVAPVSVERRVPVQTPGLAFELSSRGMGLKDIRVLGFKDRKGDVVEMARSNSTFAFLETRLTGRSEALDFEIEKVNENLFVGRTQVGGLRVTKTVEIAPEPFALHIKVATTGEDSRFVGLTTALVEQVDSPTKGNLLLPQLEKQEFFVDTGETRDRVTFSGEDLTKEWGKVKLASIGSQYFTQALLDRSPVIPKARAQLNHKGDLAQIELDYPVLNPGQDVTLEYTAFIGPKSYSLLRAIDPVMSEVVDFGFFSSIARYIFALLKWFYGLVGNWGVAIICLTLLVRLLVLPFNIYSYKSMKKMQIIQPQIQSLKERYKDDQAKANAEVLRIMRENKVNPLGGCLPILLQMPIFFALYQVLGHSIELYQAPFALWIHDLSLKDPYYILPVLMGVTMFIQQKITPTPGMDPAQAKIMMMMPVIFTVFMVSLPSGLALYMLIGALFGVAQQTYFMKSNMAPAATGA